MTGKVIMAVDESGCAGFKKGASNVFVMAGAVFANTEAAGTATEIMKKLHQARSGANREFKFHKANDKDCEEFFTSVLPCPFTIYANIFMKDRVSPGMRDKPSVIYGATLRDLVRQAAAGAADVKIIADEIGGEAAQKGIIRAAKSFLGEGKNVRLVYKNSKTDPLLQLVDMCAGATARPYNTPNAKNAEKWLRFLTDAGKIGGIRTYP